MKIALASDLHNEFYDSPPALGKVSADVLVLAGDIETAKTHSDDWWRETCKEYSQVVYIRGNHEYYGTYYTEYPELWFPDNVIVIGKNPTIIDLLGYNCLAGTMWTDLSNPHHSHIANIGMNDYRKINYSRSRYWFTPKDTTREHRSFVELLSQKPQIVISHHLPSYGSIDPKYKDDRLNAAYATELDIEGVDLWMHGHTHASCDYVKQNCRVVCNPRGYPDQYTDYSPVVLEI